MGAGYHGGFGKTSGAVAGDAVYTSSPYEFFLYIARRKDVDKDGIIDIVSHGKPYTIKLIITEMKLNWMHELWPELSNYERTINRDNLFVYYLVIQVQKRMDLLRV